MSYQQLKVFCSTNRVAIEGLVGHKIRCQDKAKVLQSYYDALQEHWKTNAPIPKNKREPKKMSRTGAKRSVRKQKEEVGKAKDKAAKDSGEKRKDVLEHPSTIRGKYTLGKLLGQGGFGKVYEAITKGTGTKVAVKLSTSEKGNEQLNRELEALKKLKGVSGIPRLVSPSVIVEGENHAIVIQLLGLSLSKSLTDDDKTVSPTKLLKLQSRLPSLSIQMLDILEAVHDKGVIHRDIKPGNWLFGLVPNTEVPNKNASDKESEQLYLIDFGLADFYRYLDGSHKSYRVDAPFKGTRRYASPNTESKIESSRRDDLISLGYMLASLYIELPWTEIYQEAKLKSRKARNLLIKKAVEMKKSFNNMKFSDYPELPKGLKRYIRAVSKLGFDEDPDYEKLRKYFISWDK